MRYKKKKGQVRLNGQWRVIILSKYRLYIDIGAEKILSKYRLYIDIGTEKKNLIRLEDGNTGFRLGK